MPTEGEVLIIAVLRDATQPLSVPEIRTALRRQGRVLSEDFIERACRSAEAVRSAGGGRYALLSRLVTETDAPIAEPEEPPTPVSLVHLDRIRQGSYVVFDLETTGTDPQADAIIQIGAVRVVGGAVADVFFAPVNPGGRQLSPSLRRILRIDEGSAMDRLIQSALPVQEILSQFAAFVGEDLLVAHNGTGLDLPFLVANGFPAEHSLLDSLELAFVARPAAEQFNLEALASTFGLGLGTPAIRAILERGPHGEATGHHNALYDAAVLAVIVPRLVSEIDDEVAAGSPYGRVLAALVPEIARGRPDASTVDALKALLTPTGYPATPRAVPEGEHPEPEVVERDFRAFVERGGREIRDSQATMVRLVSATLKHGGPRLIEAPTGTGKSLGLAYPAARHALESGGRVLLSTHTRNLQDQMESDIRELHADSGMPFRWCVLKGRGNYLCVTSLVERVRDELDPSSRARSHLDERLALAWLVGWGLRQARDGLDGELDGIPFSVRARFPALSRLTNAVRAERRRCREDRCRDARGCFRMQARARAKHADLLIVNHALWLSPALKDFPPFEALLLDEAHELEEAATNAATDEVTASGLADFLQEILAAGDRRGLLPRMLARLPGAGESASRIRGAIAAVRLVRAERVVFGRELATFLLRIGLDPSAEHGATLRLRGEGRRQYPARWRALERATTVLLDSLADLEGALQRLAAGAESDQTLLAFSPELSFLVDQIADIRRIFRDVLVSSDRRWAAWVELRADQGPQGYGIGEVRHWAVRRAPVHVGDFLRRYFDAARGVVLTSATLTIRGGDFSFLLNRVGLDSTSSDRLHRLPGAFDYGNALFVMPRYLNHVPQGRSLPFFVEEFSRELESLFTFTEGRGLVLFTARSRLQEVDDRISASLGRAGVPVFAQRGGANRDALRAAFAEDEHSVLLGLRSFWQGVDVPGRACSIVVIEKLPFPPAGDPIADARREAVAAQGGAEFEDYLLPLALLTFKQGFGRLLRTREDRGAVFFMDRRIHSRSYKADLLNTLPGYTRRPEVEDSRRNTYGALAEHVPALFDGRDVASLLASLPDDLLSEIGALVAQWDLPAALTVEEYASRRTEILTFMDRVFGFAGFRSSDQEAIVQAILTGRDVIGLLPTGAGKSLTFQLPALLRRGLTIVLSPLIALMKDQVEKLHALRLDMVDAITSHSTASEREDVLRRARSGRLRLLYISPERLRDAQLQAALCDCPVVHVVVDEAHCVSLWGPSFRPDYVAIAPALAILPHRPPIAALTATATPDIQQDIESRLGLRSPVVVRGDFDRPEIRYVVYSGESRVYAIRSANDKFRLVALLARTAEQRHECMIVYAATTRTAEEVARKLAALGFAARAYHGQMPADERSEVQELFLDDHIGIVVATKAFGMGIDKPDIRYVVHYDVPGDLESYIQESGRAGRDGAASFAVLLFNPRDIGIQEFFIQSQQLDPATLRPLLTALHRRISEDSPIELADLAREVDEEDHLVRMAIYRLEEAGWLQRAGDVALEASLTLLEDEDTLRRAVLPEDLASIRDAFLAIRRVPVLRRVTVNLADLATSAQVRAEDLEAMLVALTLRGLAAFRPFARGMRLRPGPQFGPPDSIVALDDPLLAGKRIKLDRMVAWARNRTRCRRQLLLEYLGADKPPSRCGGCDVCVPDLDIPWRHERLADVPNPSQLFDPAAVALALLEANIGRAQVEGRSPLGVGTLRSILLGNAYAILQREVDPYMRQWKDRRLRSFPQWGLLATLPGRGNAIDRVFEDLVTAGFAERVTNTGDGFEYTMLRPTAAGIRRLAGEAVAAAGGTDE